MIRVFSILPAMWDRVWNSTFKKEKESRPVPLNEVVVIVEEWKLQKPLHVTSKPIKPKSLQG
jgi:hypothetical protein